jgi:magnesium-transporting ATPase (P-type)
MDKPFFAFWSVSSAQALEQLATHPEGLTDDEARQRLARYGANFLKPPGRSDTLTLLLAQFPTGWFMESVISASVIVLVIRSRRPFFKSRPGRYLLMATLIVAGVTLIFPFTPLGRIFGFVPLPLSFLVMMLAIVALYMVATEVVKKIFYQRVKF